MPLKAIFIVEYQPIIETNLVETVCVYTMAISRRHLRAHDGSE
jgi:hypothetical protein